MKSSDRSRESGAVIVERRNNDNLAIGIILGGLIIAVLFRKKLFGLNESASTTATTTTKATTEEDHGQYHEHQEDEPEKESRLKIKASTDERLVHNFAITNRSPRQRMAWIIRTNVPERLSMRPQYGVLDPKEKSTVSVMVEPFDQTYPGKPLPKADRFTILWIKAPADSPKEFNLEWLNNDQMVSKRKNVLIHYDDE